jgi:hypothetical protein
MFTLFLRTKAPVKDHTRLWGYNAGRANPQNELTSLTVRSVTFEIPHETRRPSRRRSISFLGASG